MSIRIYALAKELKIDNKVLMDVCTELGVSIKGSSALASLAEEDAEKIRLYLRDTMKKPAASAKDFSFLAPEPPKQVLGKIPTLPSARPKKSSEAAAEESVAPHEAEAIPESAEIASVAPIAPAEEAPQEVAVPEVVESVPESPVAAAVVAEPSPVKVSGDGGVKKPAAAGAGAGSSGAGAKPSGGPGAGTSAPPIPRPASGGKGPVKGSSPRSTPLGTKLSGHRGGEKGEGGPRQSITQKIASQAEMDAPVRPNLRPGDAGMGNFPSLQPARTIRRDDAGAVRGRGDAGKQQTTIRLAPLPTAKQPSQRKQKEPEAMQPVIRLSADVLGKQGVDTKSLVEQMEQEDRAKREERGKGRPGERGAGAADKTGRAGEKGRPMGARRPGTEPGRPAPAFAGPESAAAAKAGVKKTVGGKERTGRHGGPVTEEPSRDSRLMKMRRSRQMDQRGDEDEGGNVRWRKQKKVGISTAAPRKNNYILHLPLTVRSFAEELGLQAAKVLGKLLMMGTVATINDAIDEDTANILAESFGIPVDIRPEASLEEKLIGEFENPQEEEDEALMETRPPVVTFLGHVDHGKTSLLDKIIGINVVSGEKGGITQHIRAYNVKRNDKSITFVDTPGHEAFTEMRARGANCTDIAVIVVAADDGVMPQTEEAISHARAAGVPIIVALNKIDLPGINEPKILQELASNDLLPAEWGGDVEVVRCSALTGQGIDELLDMMLMIAELHEYRANPQKPASGICLESSVQAGHGVVAKLLVRSGTLKPGDVMVCGTTCGKVKVMFDTLKTHKKHDEAGPAIPVNVVGLDAAPGAGDKFYVVPDIADARRLADLRMQDARQASLAGNVKQHTTLEGLFDKLGSAEVQTLNVILRADVRGSIEAIRKELAKLHHEEVRINILQATVGGVTEADVQLADAADAIIVGFNVVPDENARVLAEQKGVQVRRYDIIYQLTADIKAALEGMLKPEEREKTLGRALVQKTFTISRVGTVAGCRVLSGSILRDSKIRIIRDSRIIGVYPLDTLKRERDDAKEVREGYECGMKLAGFNDIKDGDILEAYQIESVARTF